MEFLRHHISLESSGQHFPISLGAVGGHGAHSGATSGRRAATGGSPEPLDAVPSDQFCEQSLFQLTKLFDFALDEIGTGYACV